MVFTVLVCVTFLYRDHLVLLVIQGSQDLMVNLEIPVHLDQLVPKEMLEQA